MNLTRSQEIYSRLVELNLPGEVWALFSELHTLQNMHPDIAAAEIRRQKDRERKRLSEVVSTDSTETHIIDSNNKTPEGGCGGKPISEEFEILWRKYPCKKSKGRAQKAYPNARKEATFEELSAGIDRLIAEKRDPKFWPYFASWMNSKGWLDEEPQKAATVTRGPWKPFKPESEPERPPQDERERQVAKLLKRTSSAVRA